MEIKVSQKQGKVPVTILHVVDDLAGEEILVQAARQAQPAEALASLFGTAKQNASLSLEVSVRPSEGLFHWSIPFPKPLEGFFTRVTERLCLE